MENLSDKVKGHSDWIEKHQKKSYMHDLILFVIFVGEVVALALHYK